MRTTAWWTRALLACALLFLLAPSAQAQAQAASSDKPTSFFGYGFRGFWDGAVVGLAAGHLATGDTYEDGEWKTLVLGAGIGAVLGVGAGVTLAFSDRQSRRSVGWYVLRDLMSGAMLGGLTGAAVGALVLIDSEHPRDVLTGAAIGGLIGAGVGIAFGILEGMDEPVGPPPQGNLRFTLVAAGSGRQLPTLLPALRGSF
jgi:hypothetical protein